MKKLAKDFKSLFVFSTVSLILISTMLVAHEDHEDRDDYDLYDRNRDEADFSPYNFPDVYYRNLKPAINEPENEYELRGY